MILGKSFYHLCAFKYLSKVINTCLVSESVILENTEIREKRKLKIRAYF